MSTGGKLNEKYGLDQRVRLVAVKCASVSPFTVTVAGSPTPVPARRLSGQAFAVGDSGSALWLPPMAPICFKTF